MGSASNIILTWAIREDHAKAHFEHGSRIEEWKNGVSVALSDGILIDMYLCDQVFLLSTCKASLISRAPKSKRQYY